MMGDYSCVKGQIRRVAIIGAGESGLASIKSCLEEGLEPVCFEREDRVGGIWSRKHNEDTLQPSLYQSFIFNTSKDMSCFSDFPFDKTVPLYPRQQDAISYFNGYADHFDLHKHISLNTEVKQILPIRSTDSEVFRERWKVRYHQNNGSDVREEMFDAVMVCSGFNHEGVVPTYPGQDGFQGTISHSCNFRSGADFEGKTVVVVGAKHSAGEVSCEISRYSKQNLAGGDLLRLIAEVSSLTLVYLSMRDGTWVIPRLLNGQIFDVFTNTRLASLLPASIKGRFLESAFSHHYDTDSLGLRPSKQILASDFMLCDEMITRILCGSIIPKKGISHFTQTGMAFADGSEVSHVDHVVYATGFRYCLPFLSEELVSEDPAKVELYLHVFPINLQSPTLAFIGFASDIGSSIPVFESQSRLAVQVFAGHAKLPNKEVMKADVEKLRKQFFDFYGKHVVVKDIVKYQTQLGTLGNFAPSITECILSGDFWMAYHLFFKPFYPFVMRLRGCHTWPGARQYILQVDRNLYASVAMKNSVIPESSCWRNSQVVLIVLLFCFTVIYTFFNF